MAKPLIPDVLAARYASTTMATLFSPEHKIVCGMALGYADTTAPVNSFRTARAGVDEFATFLD